MRLLETIDHHNRNTKLANANAWLKSEYGFTVQENTSIGELQKAKSLLEASRSTLMNQVNSHKNPEYIKRIAMIEAVDVLIEQKLTEDPEGFNSAGSGEVAVSDSMKSNINICMGWSGSRMDSITPVWFNGSNLAIVAGQSSGRTYLYAIHDNPIGSVGIKKDGTVRRDQLNTHEKTIFNDATIAEIESVMKSQGHSFWGAISRGSAEFWAGRDADKALQGNEEYYNHVAKFRETDFQVGQRVDYYDETGSHTGTLKKPIRTGVNQWEDAKYWIVSRDGGGEDKVSAERITKQNVLENAEVSSFWNKGKEKIDETSVTGHWNKRQPKINESIVTSHWNKHNQLNEETDDVLNKGEVGLAIKNIAAKLAKAAKDMGDVINDQAPQIASQMKQYFPKGKAQAFRDTLEELLDPLVKQTREVADKIDDYASTAISDGELPGADMMKPDAPMGPGDPGADMAGNEGSPADQGVPQASGDEGGGDAGSPLGREVRQ